MSAQRFIGANSREAMNQVRAALGDDALILSSRMTDAGVEIMAQGDMISLYETFRRIDVLRGAQW